MAVLSDKIKTSSVNVVTGETVVDYYTEVEWAAIAAAQLANEVPLARTHRKAEIAIEAQTAVDAIIQPPMLTQYQIRMLELLEVKTERAWNAAEQAEVDAMKAANALARAVRGGEATAYAAIEAATTVAAVKAVTL